jgi:heptosyltransferase-2
VFAPNWLGDAVMAVPSVDAIRRRYPSAVLAMAAREHLAPLYEMVPGVDEVVRLERPGRFGGWFAALRDARRLRAARFDVALLLPNSFRTAWIARRAGIAERWGYASDRRTTLLTRAVPRVRGGHQVEYYQRLLDGLGIPTESEVRSPKSEVDIGHRTSDIGRRDLPCVRIDVPDAERAWARQLLAARGCQPGDVLVGMAPGAAYGSAKQWPPERYAELAFELANTAIDRRGTPCRAPTRVLRTVLVGSAGDRAACDAVAQMVAARSAGMTHGSPLPINLAGATSLPQLAAVVAECRSFVSNDSGAMHVAAAVGVPVVAIFGSTNELETWPLPWRPGPEGRHAIVTTDVACRPCMLRECPIEGHPCMTGIDAARVKTEVLRFLRSE